MATLTFFLWIFFMAFGFLAWYFSSAAKQEERKMLIQQGARIEDLFKKHDWPDQKLLLRFGIVVLGLGAAFVFIGILNSLNFHNSEAYVIGILCLFGGASMVIAHYVGKKGKDV